MSSPLIGRSPDLSQLLDEGYEVDVREGYLLLHHVPYVNARGQHGHGSLASPLELAGDRTKRPDDHTSFFIGGVPCHADGKRFNFVVGEGSFPLVAGMTASCRMSAKPEGGYADYHAKMTTYVRLLMAAALRLDPYATATTFRPVSDDGTAISPFVYEDTASARAGITAVSAKLRLPSVAIVGLGGTGSYILDQVAKTPVSSIHLFDGDVFEQHNAFRAPGAATLDDVSTGQLKVEYFAARYGVMHRGIVPHPYMLDEDHLHELSGMSFVFLALGDGRLRRVIAECLADFDIPFIDVGMGVSEVDGALTGLLRVTTSTSTTRARAMAHLPASDGERDDVYSRNIQIADLNALNASLAVIRWKKLFGVHLDLEHEHHALYNTNGNLIENSERVA